MLRSLPMLICTHAKRPPRSGYVQVAFAEVILGRLSMSKNAVSRELRIHLSDNAIDPRTCGKPMDSSRSASAAGRQIGIPDLLGFGCTPGLNAVSPYDDTDLFCISYCFERGYFRGLLFRKKLDFILHICAFHNIG